MKTSTVFSYGLHDIEVTIMSGRNKRPPPSPVAVIDLTQDTPTNRSLRLRRNNGTGPNRRGSTARTRRQRSQASNAMDYSVLEITEEDGISDRENNLSEADLDIVVDLVETPSEQNEVCCIKSPDSGKPIVVTCPVCLEELTSSMKPMTTRCGHVFCARCLETVAKTSKKCPKCQAAIRKRSCTRLYF